MTGAAANYTAIARRFRPQTFDQVVGQQHVAQALQNAIASGRVAHAYLFTGARGVGKTSLARILAKALNCPHLASGVPCNQCDICRSISAGQDVDVLEIDGASNRGIDDVRTLRAGVNVKSMRTRYKIYIIDEVHMLTKEAFNALLKTLEEPPPAVKFVFCTTEPTRVPDTILSRCQRFDFSTIETQRIIERLAEIAEADGFQVEPAALELIARRGAGSMRDSQSLFDQLLAFGGEPITADDVHRLLGTASDDRLIELADALVKRDRARVLQEFDQALAQGVQLGELVEQLIHYVRDLMVLAAGGRELPLLAVAGENRPRLAEQAQHWGLQSIVAALEILAESRTRMARVTYDRPLAELALVRIAALADLDAIDALIAGLKSEQLDVEAGGSRTKSTASPRAARPPAPLAAAPRPATEKKSAAAEATATVASLQPGGATRADAAESPVSSVPGHVEPPTAVPLKAGHEDQLLSQLVLAVDDRVQKHLAAATQLAILGPNALELTFSESYHFSKQYCERPEVVTALKRAIAHLTGCSADIRFQIAQETHQGEPADEAGFGSHGRPAHTAQPDEFVQQALDVFGASLVRTEPLSAVRP